MLDETFGLLNREAHHLLGVFGIPFHLDREIRLNQPHLERLRVVVRLVEKSVPCTMYY